MKKITALMIVLMACIGLTGCAQNISSNSYSGSEMGAVNQVKRGVIISMRPVNIDNNSGVGGLTGTVAGAAAGSTLGHNGAGQVVGAVGGALVGGLLGNAIDKNVNGSQGYEYIIRLNNGRTISVVQDNSLGFVVRQRVMVIYGSRTRLVADDTGSNAGPLNS